MDIKKNFKQAAGELFGANGKGEHEMQGEQIMQDEKKEENLRTKFTQISAMSEEHRVAYVSVLAEDISIEGTIRAKGDVELCGTLKGDLITEGDIHVKGKVTGNLNGKNIDLLAGNVFGNISAQKDIHLDHQSLVIGNISADNVEAGGRIKGDLKIKSKTRLVSGVMLVGNVKTDAISLEEGARISGSIEMNCEGEGGFPHGEDMVKLFEQKDAPPKL